MLSVIDEPTCEEEGQGKYTCSRCGRTYTGSIEPLGHNYVKVETVKPTYTTEGYSIYECTRCGDSYSADYVEQLTLPYNQKVSSKFSETYKIKMEKSGYLTFDFKGDSDICSIKIYDDDSDRRVADSLTPEYKSLYKSCYLQSSAGSTVPSKSQIVALLAGEYEVEVNCEPSEGYYDALYSTDRIDPGYFEMKIAYHSSEETITETKNDFYYDVPTSKAINLNKTYKGFLGGRFNCYDFNNNPKNTVDNRDVYKIIIPKGSGWSQLSVSLSAKAFPPIYGNCTLGVYYEDYEACEDFVPLVAYDGNSKSEIVTLNEGIYFLVVDSDSPVEYTFSTKLKPSGLSTCVNHKYKLIRRQNATCTQNGYADYKCTVCESSHRETLYKTGHKVIIDYAVPATFISSGLTEGAHCSACGAVIKQQKAVQKLALPKLKKVKKGKKSFTAKWKKVAGVDGYQIRYSTKKNMKKAKKKSTTKAKLTVKKLKSKKAYYVQLRGYKVINGKKQYSAWSAKKKVKTK